MTLSLLKFCQCKSSYLRTSNNSSMGEVDQQYFYHFLVRFFLMFLFCFFVHFTSKRWHFVYDRGTRIKIEFISKDKAKEALEGRANNNIYNY